MLRSSQVLFLSDGVVAALAGSTLGQMKAHGPLDTFGFPESYTDFNDTVVVHGTDPNDPFLLAIAEAPLLPNPNGPLSVENGNFYGETFYWAGEADLATSGGGALLIMAVEGIWVNDVVTPGDQAVMGRLRLRIDLANPGHYVVTHPYGVDEFDVVTPGDSAINFTVDSIAAVGPGIGAGKRAT